MFIVETVEPENTLGKYKNSPKNLKKKKKQIKGGRNTKFHQIGNFDFQWTACHKIKY